MTAQFAIYELPVGRGVLGICQIPGLTGGYGHDLERVKRWRPSMVLSMTEHSEMRQFGAAQLGQDMADSGAIWQHFPIIDFSIPAPEYDEQWSAMSTQAKQILSGGGKILVHCRGGCGRSGMVLMRLMVEAGEAPDQALKRLRSIRPCAVETEEQQRWAAAPITKN